MRLEAGLDEELIAERETHRIYMRAVCDGEGKLLGYYERFEPPRVIDLQRELLDGWRKQGYLIDALNGEGTCHL